MKEQLIGQLKTNRNKSSTNRWFAYLPSESFGVMWPDRPNPSNTPVKVLNATANDRVSLAIQSPEISSLGSGDANSTKLMLLNWASPPHTLLGDRQQPRPSRRSVSIVCAAPAPKCPLGGPRGYSWQITHEQAISYGLYQRIEMQKQMKLQPRSCHFGMVSKKLVALISRIHWVPTSIPNGIYNTNYATSEDMQVQFVCFCA